MTYQELSRRVGKVLLMPSIAHRADALELRRRIVAAVEEADEWEDLPADLRDLIVQAEAEVADMPPPTLTAALARRPGGRTITKPTGWKAAYYTSDGLVPAIYRVVNPPGALLRQGWWTTEGTGQWVRNDSVAYKVDPHNADFDGDELEPADALEQLTLWGVDLDEFDAPHDD